MEAFLGTIMAVGFSYAPRGWAFCDGPLIPIAQNSALFALLGTTYGGDGVNTFALPDLRGRVVVGSSATAPGITPVAQGEKAGTNSVTALGNGSVNISLTTANLPAHTHTVSSGLTAATTLQASIGSSGAQMPVAGAFLSGTAGGQSGAAIYVPAGSEGTTVGLGGVATTLTGSVDANTGGGQPLAAPVQTQAQVPIMQPYTGLNYIIALEGIFPSRN